MCSVLSTVLTGTLTMLIKHHISSMECWHGPFQERGSLRPTMASQLPPTRVCRVLFTLLFTLLTALLPTLAALEMMLVAAPSTCCPEMTTW